MTRDGFDISRNCRAIVQSVLQEQERQRREKCVDPDLLAEILSSASSHRQRIANLLGMRDARGARDSTAISRSNSLSSASSFEELAEQNSDSNPWAKRSEPSSGNLESANSSSRRTRQTRSEIQTTYSFNSMKRPPRRNGSSSRLRRCRRSSKETADEVSVIKPGVSDANPTEPVS